MNPASRRWVGRVLRDRWRIDARISRGGVGTVYAATHKNNGSRAAIKVLHPEFSRDADTRGRFLQEGYAANHVNHPGVVRILDDDTSEDGHAYLVMELLEGELLETRRVRKGGRLPLSDVFEVGEQLLDVLAAAHDKGIVHRDIKPDNLFITKEGRLKVLDFGFAQMKSSFRTEQTATGFLLGTPGYMSPEQAVGNRPQIDAQTDIWAVGATLFMLASGEAVHAGESAAEMLVAAANFSPRSLATVTSGLNPRFVKVVDKAVAFDKKSRWQSARAMQSALREAAGQQLSGQVSRRSIPDGIPSVYEDVSGEEATEIALMTEVEELDASELESWGSSARERTVVAQAQVTDAALQSAITRPPPAAGRPSAEPERHPADDDGPTLGIASPGLGMVDPHADGGTLIMESPAALRDDAARSSRHRQPSSAELVSSAYPHAPPPSQPQLVAPHVVPYGHPPLERRPSFAVDPRAIVQGGNAAASGAHYALPPASAAHTQPARAQRGGGSRALMLIAVAVCTMIVVILAGLAVMSITD